MNTISPALPSNSHRIQLQTATQVSHGKREAVENRVQLGKSASEPEPKGVLRLIQEGHFNGVADVRLRINFFKQLQSLENVAAQDTARQAVEAFNQVVSDSIDNQPPEQVEVINALKGLQDTLVQLDESGEEPAVINEQVGTAFTDLIALLRELQGLNAENPLEKDLGTESVLAEADIPAAESPVDGGNVEALIITLEAGFTTFDAALSSTSITYQFTPPNGNGGAFDKFLDLYETLSSAKGSQDTDDQAAPQIDLTA